MNRYSNTKITNAKKTRLRTNQVKKYNTTIYQSIPETNEDLFVITQDGDRLDQLANQFYKDSTLWWYIAQANNISTMNIETGTRLRIPASTDFAKDK